MNITAQGGFGDPTDVVRRIIRKYNDFRKNSNVVKIPPSILQIPNIKKKISKLYEFWSEKEKNKMLPFDDETVAQLKKNHHLNGDLAILLMLVLPLIRVASNIQIIIS